ncbi:hypothetical protein CDAR_297871 [Caerostris darwini]|uniref:Uncharacterized protein n=1 Tax=Caerostris darwini TaxID=1538125 RepID=A0AAV4PI93_9ARAC|nr:hypothetical protein CDAR_297871 [Caerostris darwini]
MTIAHDVIKSIRIKQTLVPMETVKSLNQAVDSNIRKEGEKQHNSTLNSRLPVMTNTGRRGKSFCYWLLPTKHEEKNVIRCKKRRVEKVFYEHHVLRVGNSSFHI